MGDDSDAVPEREMKDFQFKQMKKIRVFDPPEELPKERSSLLAVSNTYGLTFAGGPRGLRIFQTKDIIAANQAGGDPNETVENVPNLPVTITFPVHHVALGSDDLTLSTCMASSEYGVLVYFFDIRVFSTDKQKSPFAYQKLAKDSSCLVIDLKWNPAIPSMLAACLSDGSITVLEVTDTVKVLATLPSTAGITSVCWSPKGKQLAAGRQNGTVVQYLPTLQEKKVIPCPPFYDSDNPVKVLDVLWLSTYVFAVAYAAADGTLETPPEVVIVSLPKKEDKRGERFLNCNDLCFGNCSERQHHYYLNHIEEWDIILAASAASVEVSVIARQEDKSNWELWLLEDSSRAELPVTDNSDDTLPVGVAVDHTSQVEIPISDEKTLPPAPILMLLSTYGVLCPFYIINNNPGAKSLITPPQRLPLEGERQPKTGTVSTPPSTGPSTVPKSETPVAPAFTPAAAINLSSASSLAPASSGAPPSSSFTSSSLKPAPGPASSGASLFSFVAPSFQSTPATNSFAASSSFSFASTTSKSLAVSGPTSSAAFGSTGVKPPVEAPSVLPVTTTPSVSFKPSSSPSPMASAAKQKLNEKSTTVETPAVSGAPNASPFSSSMFPFTSTPKATTGGPLGQPAVLGAPSLNSNKTLLPIPTTVHARPAQSMPTPPPSQKPSKAAASATKQGPPQPSVLSSAAEQQRRQSESDPIMAGIKEEIAHFQKELEELKSRTAGASFRVGTSEEIKTLRKEAEDLHTFLLEIKETTESLHGDIGTLKTTLLEGFAGVEDARTQNERNRDPGYLQLLYKKPLDPKSEAQLKDIYRLYQYVKFTSQDVNGILDLEWERYLDNKKQQKRLIAPEREMLFYTLANNREIINQQRQRLDQLINRLQQLRLYNQTSQWSMPSDTTSNGSTQSFDSELEGLRNALMKTTLDTTPNSSPKSPGGKLSPVKQAQLRSFLSKRKTPTERSTAPASLSRSAFLSPEYYESLNEDSSNSSVSQALDNEDVQAAEQEEIPVPIPRHAPVVRTPSVQPGLIGQSPTLGKAQLGFGTLTAGASGKMNLDGADSTALATKTVKHGAPASEKAPQSTIPASQAAAAAALRRQMASQTTAVSTSLTESTLKTVPQVVNVQEIRDSSPALNVSPVIGPSVPASAAQVVQQVLATVATNQPKQGAKSSVIKVQSTAIPPTTPPAVSAVQSFSFGSSGQGAAKIDTTSVSSAVTSATAPAIQTNKPFQFSSSGFGTPPTTSTATPTPTLPGIQVTSGTKDSSQSSACAFGSSAKPVFGAGTESAYGFGPLKPTSTTSGPHQSFSASEEVLSSSKPAISATAPASSTTTIKSETQPGKLGNGDGLFQTSSAGETLGSFSGLRVGQTEDTTKTTSKASASGFSFGHPAKTSAVASGFGFGASLQVGKSSDANSALTTATTASSTPVATSDTKSSSSLFGSAQITSAGPPGTSSSVAKPTFSFAIPQTSSTTTTTTSSPAATTSSKPVLSFGSILSSAPSAAVPVISSSSGDSKLQAPVEKPAESATPLTPPQQAPNSGADIPILSQTTTGNVVDLPSRTDTASPTTAISSTAPLAVSKTETVPPAPSPATPNPSASVATTATSSSVSSAPVASTSPSATTVSSSAPAQSTTTTGPLFGTSSLLPTGASLFGQPSNSNAQGTGFGQASGSTTTTTTATVNNAFGQQVTTTASTVFGQPSSNTTASTTSSGFGAPASPSESGGGFGTPAFGQAPAFGLLANNSSSGMGFGQSVFGMQPSFGQTTSDPASGSGSIFGGSSGASTSSSFSFGASTASSGGSVFGQGAAPAFGQSSGFGQGGSLFGNNTTTTPSSAFSFGQPSGFGSSTTGPVFGQASTSGSSAFGQSSGGGLFGASNSGGGGFFSGLGGKPSQDAANKNPFGASNAGFGSSGVTTSSNLFGNSGAKSFGFGNSSFGEQKPGGTFSSAGGSVATQGFGSFSSPTKPGGFGAAPVFGSPPTFGGTPSFGGTQTFGSAPPFSNSLGATGGKVFGEGTAAASAGGFGFSGSSNAVSFGALASQNQPTFGSLAQQGSAFGGQSGGFSSFGSSGSGGFGFGTSSQRTTETNNSQTIAQYDIMNYRID